MVDTILKERGFSPVSSYMAQETGEGEDIYCLRCHTKIPPGGKFCPKCGDYQWDTCMVCDKEIPEDAKYCPHCGSLVKYQTNASKLNTIQSVNNLQWWGFAIVILLLLWIVWQLFSLGVRLSGIF
jgi:predicted nucleic acid-binding Zn ribbon protein